MTCWEFTVTPGPACRTDDEPLPSGGFDHCWLALSVAIKLGSTSAPVNVSAQSPVMVQLPLPLYWAVIHAYAVPADPLPGTQDTVVFAEEHGMAAKVVVVAVDGMIWFQYLWATYAPPTENHHEQ